MRNIRWTSFHFLNPIQTRNSKETYGFPSTKPAPQVAELKDFENKLFDLTKNITFNQCNNSCQTKLKDDAKNINDEKRMIVAADKTNNFYKVRKDEYDELLQKHITKDYKKTDEKAFDDNTKDDKAVATSLELDDRIYKTMKNQAFITLKDHKPNFSNKPTCRLLNPTKPEIGKVSKQLLASIVKTVKEKSKLNQWKNTDAVLIWFSKIQNKNRASFLVFDICDFYPSISPELLRKSIILQRNMSV